MTDWLIDSFINSQLIACNKKFMLRWYASIYFRMFLLPDNIIHELQRYSRILLK